MLRSPVSSCIPSMTSRLSRFKFQDLDLTPQRSKLFQSGFFLAPFLILMYCVAGVCE
ncbi:hypothetical protein HanPI659440_Chr08g0299401 [Helianthus annuus]|nr:hypothetical protein HanPI659440_Chr08g0299401 [Helianthus annuus]